MKPIVAEQINTILHDLEKADNIIKKSRLDLLELILKINGKEEEKENG